MTSVSSEGTGRRTVTAADLQDILVRKVGAAPDLFAGGPPSGTLVDLGLDSLAFLELQTVLREQYGVDLPEDGLEMSVPEIIAFADTSLRG